MQEKTMKGISILLLMTILYANFATVISYAADTFLSTKEIENQGISTQNENVEFDAFYDGGKHSAEIDINSIDTKLNIALNVKQTGYLKDAVIDLSNSNFKINQIGESKNIQVFNQEEKKIVLNQINNGSNILESINLSIDKKDSVEKDIFEKDNIVKLTATYIDQKAKEVKIEKSIVIHTRWIAKEAKAKLQYETIKYIPYEGNNAKKLIISGKVTSFVENSILPIEETKIEVLAQKINNEYPEKVIVVADSTGATNGNLEGREFSNDNWTYDNTTGKINIKLNNNSQNGKISWKSNAQDQFYITYIYSENVYNATKSSMVKVEYNVNSNLKLYGNGIASVSAKANGWKEENEKVGELVDLNVKQLNSINKGYLYNNKKADEPNRKETEYKMEYNANIFYKDVIDEIIIQQETDKFVTEDGTEQDTMVDGNNYAYNKTLVVSKYDFDKVLGQEGKIEILNSKGDILETINKDTAIDSNNNIVIDLMKHNINNITIRISKPQSEGNIKFDITKALSKNIGYSFNQLKSFKNFKVPVSIKAKNDNVEILNKKQDSIIALEEPSQKVKMTINNDRLSTIIKNENIKLKVTLENDSIDDVLYQNPTIKIDFPKNIEILDLKTAQLFFDNELVISKAEQIDNSDGTKSIIVNLRGTQTKYNNMAAEGATIELNTDIVLNRLTPTTNTNIKVTATNMEGTTVTSQMPINFIAPTGVVATNAMTGHKENERIEVINGEPKESLIPIKSTEKEVSFEMNVINNYENSIDNIVVLGRTPFAGNKDIDTASDLGSTMDMPLKGLIQLEGNGKENAVIYYSENANANKNLQDSNNGWKTEVTDYSKIKSYMIVFNNYTMNTGEAFKFGYKAILKANLEYNQSAYEKYNVYFNNNKASGMINDKVQATKIGLTTGSIAKLDANLTSPLENGATIKAGQELEYTLTINNTGALDANDVKVMMNLPTGISYVPAENEEKDSYGEFIAENSQNNIFFKIGNIKAKTTITKKITLKTDVSMDNTEINAFANIKYSNVEIKTNTINTKIAKTYFYVQAEGYSLSGKDYVKEGDTYAYVLNIESTNQYNKAKENSNRTNTKVMVNLPEELTYESIKLSKINKEAYNSEDITNSAKVKVDDKNLTIEIGNLENATKLNLVINAKVQSLPEGTYQKEIAIKGTIQADNTDLENIEEVKDVVNRPGVKVTQTSNIPEGTTISSGEEFSYTFTVENLSEIVIDNIVFEDYLPEGIQIKGMETVYSDGTIDKSYKQNSNNNPEIKVNLKGKEKAIVEVKVMAKSLKEETRISNKGKVSNESFGSVESNSMSHVIKVFNKDDVDIGGGSEQESDKKKTKKVIGTIWIDKNKDGKKDINEEKVSGVEVLLIDNATGNVAIDSNKKECIVKTDKNGAYLFNNVYQGKYSIVFFYDSLNYSPTEYQKTGVSIAENSDAIDKTVVYQGKTQVAAVTEEINLETENQYDIDLGIIENPKFDLKLNKEVKAITVNDTKKTAKHEYNSNFAKIDFEAKYAASSSMVVEYKFIITNEGGIPGYVKKLADYLPKELKFNSELNKDWYLGKDGVIYSNSLANTIINPGESKEITLLLTKNMNSEDFGLINNSAEIYETSNDYGALDIDSIAGNKATNEDDFSTANVLTSIKTGEAIIYTTLTFTFIAIVGVGLYMIKKKVLR